MLQHGLFTYIFYDRYGQNGVAYNAADTVIIGSFKWELANNSSVPSTSGLLPASSMFEVGDYLNISTDSKDTVIKNCLWEITGVTSVSTTNNLTLLLSPKSFITVGDIKNSFVGITLANTGVTKYQNSAPYA